MNYLVKIENIMLIYYAAIKKDRYKDQGCEREVDHKDGFLFKEKKQLFLGINVSTF